MRRVYFHLCLLFLCAATAFGYEFQGYIVGENDGDQFGAAACSMDFNQDGFPDLVVSAPASDANGTSSGRVYIFFGGPDADLVPDLTLTGDAGSFFGQSVAPAGDYNGDDYEDLIVGAPFYDFPASNAGAAYLFYGSPTPDATVDHIFTGDNMNDYYGYAVAGVGDVNNDNYDDLAIGAYKADWGFYTDPGKVYVYYGNSGDDYFVDKIITGVADGERFGCAITGGDFTGDNIGDIAVGAYSFDSTQLNAGRIYVFHGGPAIDSLAGTLITGDSAGYKFGWRLTSGRINADDYSDLVMGSDGVEIDTFAAGRLYVFDGGPGFDDNPLYDYSLGRTESDLFGDAVASGVDFTGDGSHEFIGGMPGNSDHGSLAGGGVVFAGGTTILDDSTFTGQVAGDEMGKAVAFWPGFGGAVGVIFGAPGYSDYQGRVYVFKTEALPTNYAPKLDPIGPKDVNSGSSLSFAVSAVDPNWTIPALSAENLPLGASFDDVETGRGRFQWVPTLDDVGTHPITFVASDGLLDDTEVVIVTVIDPSACCHEFTGNTNCDPEELMNLIDVTTLIDRIYLSKRPLCCEASGNVSGDPEGVLNLMDVTSLIDHIYLSKNPTAPCQ